MANNCLMPACPSSSSKTCSHTHRPFLVTVFWKPHLRAMPRTYSYPRAEVDFRCPLGCVLGWSQYDSYRLLSAHVQNRHDEIVLYVAVKASGNKDAETCRVVQSGPPIPREPSYDNLKAELESSTSGLLYLHLALPATIMKKLASLNIPMQGFGPAVAGPKRNTTSSRLLSGEEEEDSSSSDGPLPPKQKCKHVVVGAERKRRTTSDRRPSDEDEEDSSSCDDSPPMQTPGYVAGAAERKRKITSDHQSSEEKEQDMSFNPVPHRQKRRHILRVLSDAESDTDTMVATAVQTIYSSDLSSILISPSKPARSPRSPQGTITPQGNQMIFTPVLIRPGLQAPQSPQTPSRSGPSGGSVLVATPVLNRYTKTGVSGTVIVSRPPTVPSPSFRGLHLEKTETAAGGDTNDMTDYGNLGSPHVNSVGPHSPYMTPVSPESGGDDFPWDFHDKANPFSAGQTLSGDEGEGLEDLDHDPLIHPTQDVRAKEVPHRPISRGEREELEEFDCDPPQHLSEGEQPEHLDRVPSMHPPQDMQSKEVSHRSEEQEGTPPEEPLVHSPDEPVQAKEVSPNQQGIPEEEDLAPPEPSILYCDSPACKAVELTDEHIWDHGHPVSFTHPHRVDATHQFKAKMFRCYPDLKFYCICGSTFGTASEGKAHLDALNGNNMGHPRVWTSPVMKNRVPGSRPAT
ncbi:hypothetical protein C8F04DRAFT_1125432 [Mycena alexandri]|uniref:Uncharacterized protein n=1 Tax=Mycena alexandri TaxID=1745969 RepID=A0AAD6WV73_9AGAR|nr:hypothetical protein C8F04DRAFT_1125432 [Mycena alexandri]